MKPRRSIVALYLRVLLGYLHDPRHIAGTIRLWRNAKISEHDVVFVVGAPRSGTTLIQALIASHPAFGSIEGETAFFRFGNLFNDSRFESFIPPDRYREALRLSNDIVTLFERTYLAQFPVGVTPVEKTPQHAKCLDFLIGHFRRAKLVNVYRDGRDCFASARRSGVIPQARSVSTFARYWVRCVSARRRLGEHRQIIDVRYEDLVSRTDEQIERLMTFLGHRPVAGQASADLRQCDRRARSVAFARLRERIDASSVGQWRNALSAREVRTFERVASGLLRELGYEA